MTRSRRLFKLTLAGLAFGVGVSVAPLVTQAQANDGPPAWAFPVNPSDFKPKPDDGVPRHVLDSTASFTVTQSRNLFFTPDWHPSEHPALPEIVAQGRKPDVMACGSCHRADGAGGPESAYIAGLPVAYFVQQMVDFRSGARSAASAPHRIPAVLMMKGAKAITDAEIQQAAAYFSGLIPRATIKVVEAATVPKTHVTAWFLSRLPGGETEPLGRRIIEVPADLERFEMRDSHAQFIAYVPPGSIEKGLQLAEAGGNPNSVACTACHGPKLEGLGPIPRLAGRSPSYIVRQLYDFKHGARAGAWSPLMTRNVVDLTLDDMVALAAYAASLPP
jgi:cytochrome c553